MMLDFFLISFWNLFFALRRLILFISMWSKVIHRRVSGLNTWHSKLVNASVAPSLWTIWPLCCGSYQTVRDAKCLLELFLFIYALIFLIDILSPLFGTLISSAQVSFLFAKLISLACFTLLTLNLIIHACAMWLILAGNHVKIQREF